MIPLKFPGLFKGRDGLYTKSIYPGDYFEEKTVKLKGEEYRTFDHRRSKLAAAVFKEISQIGIKEGNTVLYLGASHGYTPSYVSDMIGKTGIVYCLDFAPRVVRDLVLLCQRRPNMIPIMADANQPSTYAHRITQVDIVYQDVAQKNQSQIFIKNCQRFLKKGGFGLLAVKSRSIDISRRPKEIYAQVRKELEAELTIVDNRVLDPFEKDHCMFIVKN